MKYYVEINGESSLNIQGLAIQSLPAISKPLMRSRREEIDGRDGDIITKLGYSAYDKTLKIGLWGNYDINQVIAFFNQEGTITFSNEPDKYYNFTILNREDYINQLEAFREASITIHCQPYKYELNEQPVELENVYVEETGTSLTFENSVVAPINIDLKGNTEHATETGNLFDKNNPNILNATISSSTRLIENSSQYKLLYIDVVPNTLYKVSKIQSNYLSIGFTDTLPEANVEVKNYVISSDTTYAESTSVATSKYLVIRYWRINDTIPEQDILNSIVIKATPSSPTPITPLNINVVSGNNTININNDFKGLGTIYNYSFNASAFTESSSNRTLTIPIEENTTYYITKSMVSNRFRICLSNDVPSSSSASVNEYSDVSSLTSTSITNTTYKYLNIFYWTNSDTYTAQEIYDSLQVYTQSATYPINLPVKNLFNKNSTTNNKYLNSSGTETSDSNFKISDYIKVKPNTIYSFQPFANVSACLCFYDSSKTFLSSVALSNVKPNFTTPNNCVYIRSSVLKSDTSIIQIEEGNKPNTYVPYGTMPIELCKIGTYEDKFIRNSGKNLFDNVVSLTGWNFDTGETITRNNNSNQLGCDNPIIVKPNTTYIFSLNGVAYDRLVRWIYTDNNDIVISTDTSSNGKLTTPSNCTRLYFHSSVLKTAYNTTLPNPMIEENTTTTEYEPYGSGKWYRKNVIGKIVLDENASISKSSTDSQYNVNRYHFSASGKLDSSRNLIKSNYFNVNGSSSVYNSNISLMFGGGSSETNRIYFQFDSSYTDMDTTEKVQTWLSTHNTIVYYVLATATDTEITYTPLINQLNAILEAQSKSGTTNITQVNNDLPFIITASVFCGGNSVVVNNKGNIYSKPIMTIYGSGTIGVYLNDTQIFTINLGDEEYITLDTANMEAYKVGVLKNRLVSGDYNSFKLETGNNTISFTGIVEKVVIENYSRWI